MCDSNPKHPLVPDSPCALGLLDFFSRVQERGASPGDLLCTCSERLNNSPETCSGSRGSNQRGNQQQPQHVFLWAMSQVLDWPVQVRFAIWSESNEGFFLACFTVIKIINIGRCRCGCFVCCTCIWKQLFPLFLLFLPKQDCVIMERIDPECAFSFPWATLWQQTGGNCERVPGLQ